MNDLENVKVESAFLDHTWRFARPAFVLPDRWSALNEGMVKALGASGLTSAGISYRTEPANVSDVRVKYEFPDGRYSLSVGVDTVVVSILNPGWEEKDLLLDRTRRGLAVVHDILQVPFESQKVALGMHLKGAQRTNLEITRRFVNADLLPEERMEASGFTIYTDRSKILVDRSVRLPDGLFIRLEKQHPPERELPEIASDLRAFEEHVLNALGLTLEEKSAHADSRKD